MFSAKFMSCYMLVSANWIPYTYVTVLQWLPLSVVSSLIFSSPQMSLDIFLFLSITTILNLWDREVVLSSFHGVEKMLQWMRFTLWKDTALEFSTSLIARLTSIGFTKKVNYSTASTASLRRRRTPNSLSIIPVDFDCTLSLSSS